MMHEVDISPNKWDWHFKKKGDTELPIVWYTMKIQILEFVHQIGEGISEEGVVKRMLEN